MDTGTIVGAILIAAVGIAVMLLAAIIIVRRRRYQARQPVANPPYTSQREQAVQEFVPVEPPPAQFSLTDLSVSPTETKEGQTITVSVVVSNVGGSRGNYSAPLIVDNRLVASKGISLDPMSTETLSFAFTESRAGEHVVDIEGLKGSFVIPPAKFVYANMKVTPERIKEGQKATAGVDIVNVGGATGGVTAELRIKGAVEQFKEVTLKPEETASVEFVIAKKKVGFYTVELGGSSRNLVVEMGDFIPQHS